MACTSSRTVTGVRRMARAFILPTVTLTRATSRRGWALTTVPSSSSPLRKRTITLSLPSTTWLLVRM